MGGEEKSGKELAGRDEGLWRMRPGVSAHRHAWTAGDHALTGVIKPSLRTRMNIARQHNPTTV